MNQGGQLCLFIGMLDSYRQVSNRLGYNSRRKLGFRSLHAIPVLGKEWLAGWFAGLRIQAIDGFDSMLS